MELDKTRIINNLECKSDSTSFKASKYFVTQNFTLCAYKTK